MVQIIELPFKLLWMNFTMGIPMRILDEFLKNTPAIRFFLKNFGDNYLKISHFFFVISTRWPRKSSRILIEIILEFCGQVSGYSLKSYWVLQRPLCTFREGKGWIKPHQRICKTCTSHNVFAPMWIIWVFAKIHGTASSYNAFHIKPKWN